MNKNLSVAEAAQYFGVSQRDVARWVIDGNLPNRNKGDKNNQYPEKFEISPRDVEKEMAKIYTVRKAAAILGIKTASLRMQMSRGAITYTKINGHCYIYRIELKSYRKFKKSLWK